MLINKDGRICGTIGGGAVEYRSEQIAQKVLAGRSSYGHDFTLTKDDVQNLGMICGGACNVFFHYIPPKDAATMSGECWTAVETAGHFGMAMTTPVDTAPRMLDSDYTGMSLRELAAAAKSWNLTEAGFGMAAINACYNTPERLAQLNAYEPFDNYCTDGLDLRGKRIGVIGHLNMPTSVREQASEVLILERDPRPGDYPDSACDFLIPKCDVVIMTASTLVNKTLPHLLELCENAYTILAGPTCPPSAPPAGRIPNGATGRWKRWASPGSVSAASTGSPAASSSWCSLPGRWYRMRPY